MSICKHLRLSKVGSKVVSLHCAIGQGKTAGRLDAVISAETCVGCPRREPLSAKPIPSCGKRREGISDGQIVLLACLNPDGPKYQTKIEAEDCRQCTVREGLEPPRPSEEKVTATHMQRSFDRPRIFADGTIAYPKRGWEPPPPIDGYHRKSTNTRSSDAWVFIPDWPPCKCRSIEYVEKPCGAINVIAHCKRWPTPVLHPFCRACDKREAA
jgi:hypothetical protein